MYVNYFLLRTNENRKKRQIGLKANYSPRFNSFELAPILNKPKLVCRPRKLPPITAFNESLKKVGQACQTKFRKFSLVESEDSSSDEGLPVMHPKFAN
jgi:hypothetical protein